MKKRKNNNTSLVDTKEEKDNKKDDEEINSSYQTENAPKNHPDNISGSMKILTE